MHRYLKAELRRIYSRKPRMIFLAILLIACAGLSAWGSETPAKMVQNFIAVFGYIQLVIGAVEILYVYGDDFKAKTMPVAIGTGLNRRQVVLTKWVEFMIATAVDLLVLFAMQIILMTVMTGFSGVTLTGSVITVFGTWLSINAFVCLIMFIMFGLQGTNIALILYLILGSGSITSLLQIGTSALNLTSLHLTSYTLSSCLEMFKARLMLGHVSVFNLVGILVYIVIGIGLASLAFRKKELEF